jgi:hypothetical protein
LSKELSSPASQFTGKDKAITGNPGHKSASRTLPLISANPVSE